MIFSTTARGFARIDFTDHYGVACSLQQSSLATEDAILLGCNEPDPRRLVPGRGWQPVALPDGTLCNTRMHLTRDQVARLVAVLQAWLDATSDGDDDDDFMEMYQRPGILAMIRDDEATAALRKGEPLPPSQAPEGLIKLAVIDEWQV